jgi:hypothetical protein
MISILVKISAMKNSQLVHKYLLFYHKIKIGAIPVHYIILLLIQKFTIKIKDAIKRKQDLRKNTHIDLEVPYIDFTYFKICELDISQISKEVSDYLSSMYCAHRFDLLGSGWISVGYNAPSFGFEDNLYKHNAMIEQFDVDGKWLENILLPNHLLSSRKIWQLINNRQYIPIDWQKDYKSGYRYSQKKWYKDQKVCPLPGVDIKVPWELARMQHLPRLAIFSLVSPESRWRLVSEFKNQVLDFIAVNPPRMGVNWNCTMDVSIRAINLLIAYDIFTQIDDKDILNQTFRQVFANSIYEHGKHIINNLERSKKATNNHYLSNIVGLLFISSYLQNFDTKRWLAFGIQELLSEFKKQFYNDGGNYESSTHYHCLSSEIIILATALLIGLKEEKIKEIKTLSCSKLNIFSLLKKYEEQEYRIEQMIVLPDWYKDKIFKIIDFITDIMKPNGDIPQIGDNDSGRILKLTPQGEFISTAVAKRKYLNLKDYPLNAEKYWDENILNARMLVSAATGILEDTTWAQLLQQSTLEQSIIKCLASNIKIKRKTSKIAALQYNKLSVEATYSELSFRKELIISPSKNINSDLNANLKISIYPDSGIYLLKSDRIYCLICGTPNGLNGLGGHTHDDKLSFEINLDGEDIFRDPGTYIYTALPKKRNHFRNIRAHNTIISEIEENGDDTDKMSNIFELLVNKKIRLQYLGSNKISLRAEFHNIIQTNFFNI